MWNYTKKVMDHFLNPRNVGEIENPDAVGEVGNLTCGDALKLFLKLDPEGKVIEDAKFQTFGCASAIASASALTELVIGKPVEEAEKITNQEIADFLGELPEEKMHCSVMGMEALEAALASLRGETVTHDHHGDEYDGDGLDRVVCYCFSVTARTIRDLVEKNGLETVDQVTNYCKAGGGCGGCKGDIQAIIDDVRGKAAAASDATGDRVESGPPTLTNLQKMTLIQKTVDEVIRPALQNDGGDLELVDIRDDIVEVRLQGSCAGCPGAQMTLKRWVEAQLREKVLPTLVVQQVPQR